MVQGAGNLDISGRKYSPLARDVALAAGKQDFGARGQAYMNYVFTATASTAQSRVGEHVVVASGAWTNTEFSSAAPYIAQTTNANNAAIYAGILAETTAAGGAGVYAVQSGGPATITVQITDSEVAAGVRYVPAGAGFFASTASAPVVNGTVPFKVNGPAVFANQTVSSAAASTTATIAAVMIPGYFGVNVDIT